MQKVVVFIFYIVIKIHQTMFHPRKLCLFLALIIVCHAYSNSSSVLNDKSSETNRDKQYNKFTRHIFNKYGSEGIINFEVLTIK